MIIQVALGGHLLGFKKGEHEVGKVVCGAMINWTVRKRVGIDKNALYKYAELLIFSKKINAMCVSACL